MRRYILTFALVSLSLAGCKKDKGKPAGDPGGVATGGTVAKAGDPKAAEPPPAAAAATKGCPDGFVDPNNLGICVKPIDGLTRNDDSVGSSGLRKVAGGWTGDGNAQVGVVVAEYSPGMFADDVKELEEGGAGVDAKLIDKATVGNDGMTATFSAASFVEPGTQRQIRVTVLHNDKIMARCWAERGVEATGGPKLEDVLAVCASFTLAP